MGGQIAILVGLKNNLNYTKNFYYTTRALYPSTQVVFVSYNSTDGTHDWLDSLTDLNLIYHYESVEKTFSETYNKCAELATKEYVVFAHNDMILAPLFLENIEPQLEKMRIIIYSMIEPPVFSDHKRDGKLIRDFGTDVESVDIPGIHAFAEANRTRLESKFIEVTEGGFFMCIHRMTLLEIGGLDPLYNPMFLEDDDLIIRLKMLGIRIYLSLAAVCYHFVSKTSRFSNEYQERTKSIETNSHRNFIRKWRFSNTSSIKHTYDIGFVLQNGNTELIRLIEPWCSCIYTDTDSEPYILDEQPSTSINLRPRIKKKSEISYHDVMIYANGNLFNRKVLQKIGRLNEVVERKSKRGKGLFERWFGIRHQFNALDIRINRVITYEHELIKINCL